MEVALLHSSPDQSISPYKQKIRHPSKRNHRSLISPSNFRGGILHAPPHLSILLLNQQNQPPLLPLPIPKPHSNSPKTNSRNRDQSVTPKKSKRSSVFISPKKGDAKRDLKLNAASNDRIGPDPNELEKFSGSVVFTLSPPPSSLPLPTFSLRQPKLISCNAEVAGVDAGATDNLRRLLRLR